MFHTYYTCVDARGQRAGGASEDRGAWTWWSLGTQARRVHVAGEAEAVAALEQVGAVEKHVIPPTSKRALPAVR